MFFFLNLTAIDNKCYSFVFIYLVESVYSCRIYDERKLYSLMLQHFLYGAYIYLINISMQGHRHVLATDEWLRVKGCDDVFAIGDCASVDQRKIIVCDSSLVYLVS